MTFMYTRTSYTNVYIGISSRMMKSGVICLVNIAFCDILEISYIVQIAKGRTSPVFAFNMQTPDQVECLTVFCMLKENTWLVTQWHTVTPSIDMTLHQFLTITDLDLITEFDFLPNCTRFP